LNDSEISCLLNRQLPIVEWAIWWDKTIDRWHKEGLPLELQENVDIRAYFSLDSYNQLWVSSFTKDCPCLSESGAGYISTAGEYHNFKKFLYPNNPFEKNVLSIWNTMHQSGEMVIWFTLEGFFWHPRSLFGIEKHIFSFYDQPELMHEINKNLLDYHIRIVEQICEICEPDFMTIAEDMSYNNGPMISRKCFDEFLAPYYLKLTKILKKHNIIILVDSDGDVTQMIPWLENVGVQGILPLERAAGCDIFEIRQKHPKFCMIGGFDKTVMSKGEIAMRKEFERLLPAMKGGGYIPSVDHQTPPDVSLNNYCIYVSLLREYVKIACE